MHILDEKYEEWLARGEFTRDEATLVYEVGGRALSWTHDVGEYEYNSLEDVAAFISRAVA